MVDNGVTHNFMKQEVSSSIILHIKYHESSFKVVNTKVERVVLLVKWVTMNLCEWSGDVNFIVVFMDHFEFVLRKYFMRMMQENRFLTWTIW
jgi:hypothetical protein